MSKQNNQDRKMNQETNEPSIKKNQ